MNEKYKNGAVAYKMTTDIVKVSQDSTMKDVLGILSRDVRKFEMIDYIYVIDSKGKLLGVLSLSEIFKNPGPTRVSKVMTRRVIAVSPAENEERVAHLALKHGIKSIPVVQWGKLLGAVPAESIMHIINRSLQKNILSFAGIHKSHLKFENVMDAPLMTSIKHRIPWLLIGLLGIIVTAAFIDIFEGLLASHLILAFFIPAIVYMSDGLGTQHQTLFIRDLAISKFSMSRYFWRQTLIALGIGLILSVITYGSVQVFWGESYIGLIISIAMFITLLASSTSSLLTTYLIFRAGGDPALGGGPLATIISDFSSVVIYFLLASVMLGTV